MYYKMENNYELKEIYIKNFTCYYFDDIIKFEDFDFDNILINGKSYKNTLTYNFSYKILIGAKTLRIRFDKINGSISIYDESRYLVLLGPKKYDLIYDRIRYLIGLKSNIKYVFFETMEKSMLILTSL